MAIFKNKETTTNHSKQTAIISQGVTIKGNLDLSAKLHVEGVIEGNINSNNEISIGKDGKIIGELVAKKLIINGRFEGKAECDVIEVLEGGVLHGDIVIQNIVIEPNGCFIGTSTLKEHKEIKKAK